MKSVLHLPTHKDEHKPVVLHKKKFSEDIHLFNIDFSSWVDPEPPEHKQKETTNQL